MFASTISLLNGVFMSAVILLMIACMAGSTVAALRAVRGAKRSSSSDELRVYLPEALPDLGGGRNQFGDQSQQLALQSLYVVKRIDETKASSKRRKGESSHLLREAGNR